MSYYTSGAMLQNGSSGYDVEQLQKFLASKGYYSGAIDGAFGPKTTEALKLFQGDNGLTVDGIAGPKTLSAAGFKNYNDTINAPNQEALDTTTWDSTTEGGAAKEAYDGAKSELDTFNEKGFTFSEKDWLETIKENILNPKKFNYNFNEDALYQQYADKYIQQGKLAMADTMGQAAAMTGGYGSSYAAAAGNQAYQAQLANLNDVIPELYGMALERYKMDREDTYNQYGMLLSEYEREYGKWSDEYNQLLDALGIAKDDYYKGGEIYRTEQGIKNSEIERQNENAWKETGWYEDQRLDAKDDASNYETSTGAVVTGGGSGSGGGNGSGSGSGSGYDNGSVSESDIKAMQNALGITADGKWGPKSTEAAGGRTADAAYQAWKNGELGTAPKPKGYSDYSEEAHQAAVKENGGSYYQTALNDLKKFAAQGWSNAQVMEYLQEMVGNSLLSRQEYMSLYNKYRDHRL